MYTLHFAKAGMFFTEVQLTLNKFQGYKILSMQINVSEKKENNGQNRNQNVYFLMCICNYEAKGDTEAVFCIQGSVSWFTDRNQFKISHANCISNTPSTFFQAMY